MQTADSLIFEPPIGPPDKFATSFASMPLCKAEKFSFSQQPHRKNQAAPHALFVS
jgi:hypothetical protein